MKPFTDKEKLVLAHLMWGATDKQIMDRTGLAFITVRGAIKSIVRKIGVRNRTQVALWALARSANGSQVPGRVA